MPYQTSNTYLVLLGNMKLLYLEMVTQGAGGNCLSNCWQLQKSNAMLHKRADIGGQDISRTSFRTMAQVVYQRCHRRLQLKPHKSI